MAVHLVNTLLAGKLDVIMASRSWCTWVAESQTTQKLAAGKRRTGLWMSHKLSLVTALNPVTYTCCAVATVEG